MGPNLPAAYAYDTRADDRTWIAQAVCRTENPEDWFPERETLDDPHVQRARRVCRSCPVQQDCGSYAMARRWLTGIWAGTTTRQRSRWRNQLAQRAA